jgi:hypothetical protein
VLLLKRCRPGTQLRASPPVEHDLVIVDLLQRLWIKPLPCPAWSGRQGRCPRTTSPAGCRLIFQRAPANRCGDRIEQSPRRRPTGAPDGNDSRLRPSLIAAAHAALALCPGVVSGHGSPVAPVVPRLARRQSGLPATLSVVDWSYGANQQAEGHPAPAPQTGRTDKNTAPVPPSVATTKGRVRCVGSSPVRRVRLRVASRPGRGPASRAGCDGQASAALPCGASRLNREMEAAAVIAPSHEPADHLGTYISACPREGIKPNAHALRLDRLPSARRFARPGRALLAGTTLDGCRRRRSGSELVRRREGCAQNYAHEQTARS